MKEITIDYALRETWLTVAKMYNEEAKAHNNTMAMGFTLLSIDPKTGSPSTALGPKMGMEATSLSRILKSLEAKGFICRKPNPNDGRGVIIHLTKVGLEKRTLSKDAVLQFNNVIKNNISEEKLTHFFEVTEAINTLIGKKKIFEKN
ncbi:MarR family transcriptional regulator [Cellulophaga sp. F20128]|uniref:MarR family winged helix-turn-helix transcriptional regulator n=1 Tax=Cellulophaga sp. F20128 TaxID=2926413 RepID=UPI001FF53463|nr:MarR family transcriptional regulator [Cellulophaga sp. F20128]MCK0156956.1 MarR family transcriptional regulator [Cellulophaga sp. F20128]